MAGNIDYFGGMDSGYTSGLAGLGIDNDTYGSFSPDTKLQFSTDYRNNTGAFTGTNKLLNSGKGLMDSLGGFGSIVDGISGLAGLWMDYSKLKAQKASSRDAHNASAKMYNNQLTRARDVQASISGRGKTTDGRTNVRQSTV